MMTTHTPTLSAFTLSASEGRTTQRLNLLGQLTLVKLADSDTRGAAAILHQIVPPQAGPPLHRHSYEDEWFYILDGEITIEVDGVRSVLARGDSAYAPRGTVHSFRNFGDSPATMLAVVTPGHFNLFFEELCSLHEGRSTPNMAGMERLAGEYGIEILGPPLS